MQKNMRNAVFMQVTWSAQSYYLKLRSQHKHLYVMVEESLLTRWENEKICQEFASISI